MAHRPFRTLALCLSLGVSSLALAAGSASAQSAGDDRRFDRIERDLRTLQSIIQQGQATGQPVVVKPEGPDPAINALQSRVDDLEASLQRINGQIETLGHDIEEARRAETASVAERRAQTQQMNDRLGRIEAQLTALAQAQSAADPTLGEAGELLPGDPGAPLLQGDAAATARAQAQNTGVLGGPPAPPPPAATPAQVFAAARELFTSGDQPGATGAFQDFIARYPTNARTPEAYYWLGESFYAQMGYQNATAAYASALRNKPTTGWAPQAMVRLSQALLRSKQNAQACAALAEFDKTYAARASAALKANAETVRRSAKC